VQDDKAEPVVNETEKTCDEVTDESEKKEFVLELVDDKMVMDMDIDVDESANCVLEDVLLIDSEDGIDEDTIPSNEADNYSAKPKGIDILFIMCVHCIFYYFLKF